MSFYTIYSPYSDWSQVDERAIFKATVKGATPFTFELVPGDYVGGTSSLPKGEGTPVQQLNRWLSNTFPFPGYKGGAFGNSFSYPAGGHLSDTIFCQIPAWPFLLERVSGARWEVRDSRFKAPFRGDARLKYDAQIDRFYIQRENSDSANFFEGGGGRDSPNAYIRSRPLGTMDWTAWFAVTETGSGTPEIIYLQDRPLPGRIYETSFTPQT